MHVLPLRQFKIFGWERLPAFCLESTLYTLTSVPADFLSTDITTDITKQFDDIYDSLMEGESQTGSPRRQIRHRFYFKTTK